MVSLFRFETEIKRKKKKDGPESNGENKVEAGSGEGGEKVRGKKGDDRR